MILGLRYYVFSDHMFLWFFYQYSNYNFQHSYTDRTAQRHLRSAQNQNENASLTYTYTHHLLYINCNTSTVLPAILCKSDVFDISDSIIVGMLAAPAIITSVNAPIWPNRRIENYVKVLT